MLINADVVASLSTTDTTWQHGGVQNIFGQLPQNFRAPNLVQVYAVQVQFAVLAYDCTGTKVLI